MKYKEEKDSTATDLFLAPATLGSVRCISIGPDHGERASRVESASACPRYSLKLLSECAV